MLSLHSPPSGRSCAVPSSRLAEQNQRRQRQEPKASPGQHPWLREEAGRGTGQGRQEGVRGVLRAGRCGRVRRGGRGGGRRALLERQEPPAGQAGGRPGGGHAGEGLVFCCRQEFYFGAVNSQFLWYRLEGGLWDRGPGAADWTPVPAERKSQARVCPAGGKIDHLRCRTGTCFTNKYVPDSIMYVRIMYPTITAVYDALRKQTALGELTNCAGAKLNVTPPPRAPLPVPPLG